MGERGRAALLQEIGRFLRFEAKITASDLDQLSTDPEPGQPQGRVDSRTQHQRERGWREVYELLDALVDARVRDQVVVIDHQRQRLTGGSELVDQALDQWPGING